MKIVGKTLEDRFIETANRPAGFDYMRLTLAILIISFHSYAVSYGNDDVIWSSALRAPFSLLIPMFFSLSGFLVSGSLVRCETLVSFLGLRVLRIVPALAGEVLLSAFILGSIFTVLPLHAYFSDLRFYYYFLNIFGDIHYYLPGVFLHNPFASIVNSQLWTVPFELLCYLTITIVSLVGLLRRRVLFLLAIIGLHLFLAWYSVTHPGNAIGGLSGKLLVINFLVGILFFFYRDRIPWNAGLFAIALAVSLWLMSTSFGDRFSMIPVTYVTVYLGLTNPPRSRILLSGDYSYGMYLYGWPLQQAFAAIGPATQQWYWNILLAVPSAGLMAFASWRLIEKPALGLRHHLRGLEKRYVAIKMRLLRQAIPSSP